MSEIVDCRGLACPQPVIKTKAAMAGGAADITAIVDSETSANNVTRMAEKAGWTARQERQADGTIYVRLSRPGEAPAEAQPARAAAAGPTVVLVRSQYMGVGDDELGAILMRGFFHAMLELDEPPAQIIFLNSGVRLTVADSPILADVQALAQRGVEIWSCGTCLNFFKLTDQLAVGQVSNMYSILEMLMAAGRIITP